MDRNEVSDAGKHRRIKVALHPEGVDRNVCVEKYACKVFGRSPSTRRAWIEIVVFTTFYTYSIAVALHPEGVDRNRASSLSGGSVSTVALHPEGVDRNAPASAGMGCAPAVALHPEGVDRNICKSDIYKCAPTSPSTRRAWIEIKGIDLSEHQGSVALHPEGVDRNRREQAAADVAA